MNTNTARIHCNILKVYTTLQLRNNQNLITKTFCRIFILNGRTKTFFVIFCHLNLPSKYFFLHADKNTKNVAIYYYLCSHN